MRPTTRARANFVHNLSEFICATSQWATPPLLGSPGKDSKCTTLVLEKCPNEEKEPAASPFMI